MESRPETFCQPSQGELGDRVNIEIYNLWPAWQTNNRDNNAPHTNLWALLKRFVNNILWHTFGTAAVLCRAYTYIYWLASFPFWLVPILVSISVLGPAIRCSFYWAALSCLSVWAEVFVTLLLAYLALFHPRTLTAGWAEGLADLRIFHEAYNARNEQTRLKVPAFGRNPLSPLLTASFWDLRKSKVLDLPLRRCNQAWV